MNRLTLILSFVMCSCLMHAQNWTFNGFTPGQEIGYEQDGNTIWKLTSNNIYKSFNGGATWNQNIDFANAPFYQEGYLPSDFATFYPIFDADNSRVHGDFMLLALRTNFSNREYWTTPDAGLTFNTFDFDADFFVESYNLGNNRYMIQVADFDNTQPSFYRCKWFYSGDGGQSFSQVIFDYNRNARIVGNTNTSFIIHDDDKIHYHNFSNFNLTQTVNLPADCEVARVVGNTIQAVTYDVENAQTATAFTMYSSNNGGASFNTVNNTKPTGFVFDFSVVDNFLFFFDNGLYRFDLDNFSNPPTIFPSLDTPRGPFKKTLDGQMVNTQPVVFNARFEDFNNPFYTSSNHWTTIEATEKVPFSLDAMSNFATTNTRFFGNDAYATSDGKDYTQVGDFFGSALKSDIVYLDDAMWTSTYSDPSSTAYFSNDGLNFKTTNEFLTTSNFPGDAEFYQAGDDLIARAFTNFDPEFDISSDNGNTWSKVPNSGLWGRSMFTDSKNGTLYGWQTTFGANGTSGEAFFAKSTDNGVSWRFIDNNFSNLGLSTTVYNGAQWMAYNNHLFARTESDLVISSDGGLTYSSVPFPNSFHDACVWITNGILRVDTKDEKIYTLDLDQWLGANPAPTQDGYQVDIELSIRLEPANPAPFSDFDVIVTLSNTGSFTANNINVKAPFLSSPVAVRRGAENPTYSPNFDWTNASNNSLAPGESATASFPFYRLDGGEIITNAYVRNMLQPDVDSEPGDISDFDNPEDDEAIFPAPIPNGSVITVDCPDNVLKEESSPTGPIGGGFTGFGDVILPRPTATTTCPGGITSIEHVGLAPTFQMGPNLWLDGPGEYAIIWEIKDACGGVETCLYSAEVTIPSFQFGFTNCPQNIVVTAPTNANGVVVFYDQPTFESNCPTLNTNSGITEGFASGSLFPLGTTRVTHFVENPQCGTAMCSFNVTVLSDDSPSSVDLELSMTQSVDDPVAFSPFSRTVTVTNTGTEAANFIEISIPLYEGMVFSGGEEFTATQGTFSPYGNQSWLVGALGVGQSANIEVRYYPLENNSEPGYAQVIGMGTSQDIDSTPNNGTPPIVNEDDEASTDDGGNTGGSVFFWENCPSDITVTAATGGQGAIVNYTNPTLNDSSCPFLVSNSGSNFSSGDFFPIGTTTVTIFAGNPQCGTVECSFDVTVLSGTTVSDGVDLELSMSQSEPTPTAFGTFQRTVTVHNTGSQIARAVNISIPLLSGMVFSGGEEYTASQGNYQPYGNELWAVGNVEAGQSASITITYYALENIITPGYAQVFSMNGTDIDSTPNNGTPPTVNEDDEANTDGSGGSGMTNLPDLTISNFVIADIILNELTDYRLDINNLGNVVATADYSIELYLSTDNTFSGSDMFVGNIRTGNTFPGTLPNIDAQLLAGTFPTGQQNLIVVVDAHEEIAESNEANNITVYSVNVISPNAMSDGADLNLSVALDDISQAQYSAYSITYTLTNEGNESTSDVEIDVPVPTGVVYSGGDEFEASKGSLGIYFDDVWRVGALQSGETATLSINYYKLSAGTIQHYAQVTRSTGADPDSTPDNGQCCTAVEDDEASISTNSIQARRSNNNQNVDAFTVLDVVPNPSNGERVILRLDIAEAQEKEIYIYDLLGKQVVTQKVNLVQGYNEVTLRTQDLPSGYYQVLIEDVNMKFVPTRFIIDKL